MPVTPLGKCVAALCALSGILVLAIPITIISTNFNEEYDTLRKEKEVNKLRIQLLKDHFEKKRFGADAMNADIQALVHVSCSYMYR